MSSATPPSGSPAPLAGAVEDPAAAFKQAVEYAAEEEAYAIGVDAYLYGYPRVELARRIHNETKRVSADQVIYAPPNRFYYFDHLGRPGDGLVIKAPNNDTIYGSAYLDLSAGPVVLRVPHTGGRYYVALIVDAAGSVATRLNRTVSGPGGVDYLFTGPAYEGGVPPGMRQIKQAGNDLWLLMRVACSGGTDEAEALTILRRFGLAPLGDLASLPETNVNVPVTEAPIEQPLAPLDNLEFFRVMAEMLERNPVSDSDRGLLARWTRIGVVPGRFDLAGLSPTVQRGLTRAIAAGSQIVAAAQFGIANTINGWNYSDKIGRIKDDWALVAAIARGGYGNMPEDSVYHQRNLDDKGDPLTGEYSYTMTFESGCLPPVGEFWSITAYDQQTFDLIENPIQRYSIGDRTPGLKTNANGSLTLYLQHAPPTEAVQRANWLPVTAGPFYLVMRSYDPSPDIASGKWAPPPVLKTE